MVKPGDTETCAKLESKESLRAYFDEDFPMVREKINRTTGAGEGIKEMVDRSIHRTMHRSIGPQQTERGSSRHVMTRSYIHSFIHSFIHHARLYVCL